MSIYTPSESKGYYIALKDAREGVLTLTFKGKSVTWMEWPSCRLKHGKRYELCLESDLKIAPLRFHDPETFCIYGNVDRLERQELSFSMVLRCIEPEELFFEVSIPEAPPTFIQPSAKVYLYLVEV